MLKKWLNIKRLLIKTCRADQKYDIFIMIDRRLSMLL